MNQVEAQSVLLERERRQKESTLLMQNVLSLYKVTHDESDRVQVGTVHAVLANALSRCEQSHPFRRSVTRFIVQQLRCPVVFVHGKKCFRGLKER